MSATYCPSSQYFRGNLKLSCVLSAIHKAEHIAGWPPVFLFLFDLHQVQVVLKLHVLVQQAMDLPIVGGIGLGIGGVVLLEGLALGGLPGRTDGGDGRRIGGGVLVLGSELFGGLGCVGAWGVVLCY
jgi:hypothetical protein